LDSTATVSKQEEFPMPHKTLLRHDYYLPDGGSAPKVTLMLAEQIANSVAEDIIRGVYAPGQQLVEMTLAETYKVSRGPVRDALQLLEIEGLVVIQPRRGATVTIITPEKMKEVFEVRAVLYGLIASDVAAQRDAATLERLQAGTDLLKANLRVGADTFFPVWAAFNLQVVEAGRNGYARKFLASLLRLTMPVTRKVMLDEGNRAVWIADWEAVLKQIRRGDVRAADDAARHWIMGVYEKDAAIAANELSSLPKLGDVSSSATRRRAG
jgi:DNA-binding GntR family transcriptional regulator